jgi:hypothetical protein
MVLGSLNLTHDERGVIQQALEKMARAPVAEARPS